MSFTINTHPVGAPPAYDARERKAHEWRHDRQAPAHGESGRPGEAEASPAPSRRDSHLVRRAHHFRATLGDSISFLQTQEEALLTLKAVLESDTPATGLAQSLASLEGETFNSLRLFGDPGGEEVFYLADAETNDPLPIPRPAINSADSGAPDFRNLLAEKIRLALAANRSEQDQLLGIAPVHDAVLGDEAAARETTIESLRGVLLDPRRAIAAQANAAAAGVLHML
jgi:hypothetical protein